LAGLQSQLEDRSIVTVTKAGNSVGGLARYHAPHAASRVLHIALVGPTIGQPAIDLECRNKIVKGCTAMSLNLAKTVVDILAAHPESKFTARQIAQRIFETFPAECQEKKKNSTSIKTDGDLIQQIVAEIGSQRPALQKRNLQIKTTEGRPRQYYWTEKSDQTEVNEVESPVDTQLGNEASADALKESGLYPLLSSYLWSELGIYSKRIDEKKSSNKQGPKGNKWLYPDLVGMEDLTADWHQEIKG
jgi:hypothetical protein